jgi:hypothetical protein
MRRPARRERHPPGEEAAIELGVAPPTIALGNRSEESLPELAMKEQFALDRVRFLLLDDEGHAPASLTLGDDAMRTAARAVLDTDSCGAHDLQVAMPPVRRCEETAAEPCRIEDGLVRRNLHALTVCGETTAIVHPMTRNATLLGTTSGRSSLATPYDTHNPKPTSKTPNSRSRSPRTSLAARSRVPAGSATKPSGLPTTRPQCRAQS